MHDFFFRRIFCAGALALCAVNAFAAELQPTKFEQEVLDDTALEQALSQSPAWLALLHINRGATMHSRGESYVDDPKFFLSADGQTDRLSELQATIRLLRPDGAIERCRFPARYRFLASELGWQSAEPFAHCADYLQWRNSIPSGRAVLVFPASYLNSPSSMFGHTLLRLDSSDAPDTVWQSWAVNFGAVTTEKDNSLLYVYRGLAGGYPGRFVIVPYVTKVQEYSHLENRDIWEYSLDLTDVERARMIDHLWELQEINFDYYFFDENCSFRLLELLDVARPGSGLIEGFRFAEVPVNTVRTLYDQSMVSERIYRPSKAVLLQADIDALTTQEQRLVKALLDDPAVANGDAFMAFSPQRRHLMARTAYKTLRLRERKHVRNEKVASTGFALLRVMSANAYEEEVEVAPPSPPESGHGTQMIGGGGGQLESSDFGELYYRFTYHDLIDNNRGFLKGAQIEGLDFRFRSTESDTLKLESADIIHIRSLAPRNRFIKPISWYVHGGLERAMAGDRKRLVRFVQGGAGASWRLGLMQPFALATVRLENNSVYSPLAEGGGGANIGALWYLEHAQINTSVEGLYFGNDEYRHRWKVDVNLPINRQNGIRFGWQRDGWRGDAENSVSVAWRHYFD